MVKVGDKIRVLVDGAACTSEKADTILNVVSLLEDGRSFLTSTTTISNVPGFTWVFYNDDVLNKNIEIVERTKDKSHDFHVKRLKALKKSAKEHGWVQLGLGDVDMLDKLISLLER